MYFLTKSKKYFIRILIKIDCKIFLERSGFTLDLCDALWSSNFKLAADPTKQIYQRKALQGALMSLFEVQVGLKQKSNTQLLHCSAQWPDE